MLLQQKTTSLFAPWNNVRKAAIFSDQPRGSRVLLFSATQGDDHIHMPLANNIYIYIYICVCVYIHVYIFTHIYMYINTYIYIYIERDIVLFLEAGNVSISFSRKCFTILRQEDFMV
jgi:hypothetical protein